MLLDVSPIWNEECSLLSASQFELGPNAGKITWANCIELATRLPLITDKNRQDARDHFRNDGAWDDEEIEAWSDTELSARCWQEAAAYMRDFEDCCGADLAVYERARESGLITDRLMLSEKTATLYLGC